MMAVFPVVRIFCGRREDDDSVSDDVAIEAKEFPKVLRAMAALDLYISFVRVGLWSQSDFQCFAGGYC